MLAFALNPRPKTLPPVPTLLNHLIKQIEWKTPDGVQVDQICARGECGELTESFQQMPQSIRGSLLLTAPFVDGEGLAYLQHFIPLHKIRRTTLISTSASIDSLQPNPCNVQLRMSDYPPVQHLDGAMIQLDEEMPAEIPDADDGHSGRGLHAKLVLASNGSAPSILVLGSANLPGAG